MYFNFVTANVTHLNKCCNCKNKMKQNVDDNENDESDEISFCLRVCVVNARHHCVPDCNQVVEHHAK